MCIRDSLGPAYAKNNQLIVNAYYTVVNNENVIPTGADSVTTVSYTHLDVYKRQACRMGYNVGYFPY